jgi:transmembrane sensor
MTIINRDTHAQAAHWFSLVRSGEINIEEDQSWRAWIGAEAQNLEAYENVELTWELSGELRARQSIRELLDEIDGRFGPKVPSRPPTVSRPLRPRWRNLAAAAIVLLAVLTVVVFSTRLSVDDYEAGIGEQKVVTLADHSVITLNTRTHLRVHLTRSIRRVDLLNGEALFNVAKDGARPFEVHALGGISTAVGTEFDVHIAGASTQVTVLEGRVNVRADESRDTAVHTQLSAGQTLAYSADRSISKVQTADINAIRGWQAHRVVFTDMALSDALDEYNRYTKLPIVLGDKGLASRRINGVFRIDDQTSFINALEQGLQVTAAPTGESIVLKPR